MPTSQYIVVCLSIDNINESCFAEDDDGNILTFPDKKSTLDWIGEDEFQYPNAYHYTVVTV